MHRLALSVLTGGKPFSPPVVLSLPVFSAQSAPAGTVGVAYSYQFVASGSPTFSLGSGTLPAGLSLNSSTGVLSGTPTNATAYTFVINATNAAGTKASTSQSVTIAASSGPIPQWVDTNNNQVDGATLPSFDKEVYAVNDTAVIRFGTTVGGTPDPSGYNIQVYVDDVASGPSGSGVPSFSFTVISGYLNKTLSFTITASNGSGTSQTYTSTGVTVN